MMPLNCGGAPLKKILVTTDLSEESRVAFGLAREQAKAFNASIILLAIIEDPAQAAVIYALDFPVKPDSEIQSQLHEKVINDLNMLASNFFAGVPVDPIVIAADGPVHSEIIQFAKTNDIDLIVMSTHGRTGLSRMLIGSITERVVREAPCAILTVPGLPKKQKLLSKVTQQ
jgi:nucleotide-binding universal stress UspA family protein